MTNSDQVVFIGSEESVFVTRTQETLNQKGISVAVIDPNKHESKGTEYTLFHKIWLMFKRFRRVRQLVREAPKTQTAIVHFLSVDCFWLIPMLSNHFDRVVGLAYGSDVLRRVKSRDFLLRMGLKRLDVIAATNDNVLNTLLTDFPFLSSRSPRVIRFGLPGFDELQKIEQVTPNQAKQKMGFNSDKVLVCLGYSASSGQRQIELVDFFANLNSKFENYTFVVPVQYGPQKNVEAVVKRCAEVNIQSGSNQFIPLTKFHDPEKLALMRRATDVLINHSVSDAFSGTVQEVVYAGNLVLAVDHLPYDKMPGFGSAILNYEKLDDAVTRLTSENLSAWRSQAATRFVENRTLLNATSSWEAVFPEWRRLVGADPSEK